MHRILVADDNSIVRSVLCDALEKAEHDFEVVTVKDGDAAFTKFEESHFDLVITDLKMPGKSGVELVEAIRKLDITTPVIVITAYGGEEIRSSNGFPLNIFRCLNKPLRIGEIRKAAQDALGPKLQMDGGLKS